MTKKGNLSWGGFDYYKFIEAVQKVQEHIRQTVTFSNLPEGIALEDLAIPKIENKKITGKQIIEAPFLGQKTKFIRMYGGAGEEGTDIPQPKLKEITDHYKPQTRKFFTEVGLRDHIIAPSLDRRADSIYEDGFDLVLEEAAMVPQNTSTENTQSETQNTPTQQATPEAGQQPIANTTPPDMQTALVKLQTWCEDNDLLHIMRDMDTVEFCQGKAAALITPGLAELQPQELPINIEVITAEDLGNPIVDVGLTRNLVGVRLELDDKKVARADEIVYMVAGKQGLRREGKFQGISKLEPVLMVSKIIRRIYDLDFSEAVTSAYITKVLFKVAGQGDESDQDSKIKKLIKDFFTMGKIAFAMSEDVQDIKEVQPKVDWPMLSGIEEKLADLELGLVGVPKSIMNRTQQLNRDTATIQAIQFVRFVRKPAEKHLAETFENQLLNPLFAHLMGKKLSEIPFRVRIKRRMPEEGDIDAAFDGMAQKKNQEITQGSLQQDDAISAFGAAGQELLVRETKDGYVVKPYQSN